MKLIRLISRIIVGLVFIFSGFVKAVDPWGTAYKLNDYFYAMGLEFLAPFSFIFSVLLIYAEFVIGILLTFNSYIKLASLFALLFMLIFTPLTFWLAIANPVSDCGCFGDAVKLTNWETFWKNVVLIILTIIVFLKRQSIYSFWSKTAQFIIFIVSSVFIIFVMYYSYVHLPIIDFLPYKKGNNLKELMQIPPNAPKDEYIQYVILKDTIENKEIKIDINTYANDSTYWASGTKYKYISITDPVLVKKGYEPPIHDFNIYDEQNNNYIDSVLNYKGYSFLFVSHSIDKASSKNLNKIKNIYEFSIKNNILFFALTASTEEAKKKFLEKNKLPFKFYFCDETTLKTMIRSNPGLLLLKGPIVIEKWSFYDFPEIDEIKQIIK
ncbi:MAG: DoxX family protein [Bacteroidales bacterium]|nr:DoxX family protein [Bacteroidales bacterium]